LQGWELKFPDTPITDEELINNARKKAISLGIDSFLVWNVSSAALYRRDEKDPIKIWDDLNYLIDRTQVESANGEWSTMLHKILDDLVEYFNSGTISPTAIIDSMSGKGIADLILQNTPAVASKLEEIAACDSDFADKVTLWWLGVRQEYRGFGEPYSALARILLVSWTNKLIFGHILKSFHGGAGEIDNITGSISVSEAIEKIETIPRNCAYEHYCRCPSRIREFPARKIDRIIP